MSDKIKKTKTFLIVSNIVIILMCVASVLGYFLMPVAKVGLHVKVDKPFLEFVKETFSEKEKKNEKEVTKESGGDGSMLAEGIDAELIINALIEGMGNDSFTLSAGVKLTPARLLGSIPVSHDKATSDLIRDNIDFMVDKLCSQFREAKPLVTKMVKNVVQAASGKAVQNSFNEFEKIIAESGGTSDQNGYKEFCERVGLTEDNVNERVSEIIDKLSGDGLTAPEIARDAEQIYRDIYDSSIMDSEFGQDVLDRFEYDPDGFYNGIVNFLTESGALDENGRLNFDSVIDSLLVGNFLDLLPGDDKAKDIIPGNEKIDFSDQDNGEISSASSTSAATSSAVPAPAAPGSAASVQKDSLETFRETVSSYLYKLADRDTYGSAGKAVHIVLIVFAVLLLIHIISWIYLMIKIIAKFSKPNPGVTLWVPMVFGWSLISLLALFPYIRVRFSGVSRLFSMFGAKELLPGNLPELGFSYATGGIIAAICAIALFIFGFVYRHFRKKLDRLYTGAEG